MTKYNIKSDSIDPTGYNRGTWFGNDELLLPTNPSKVGVMFDLCFIEIEYFREKTKYEFKYR